MIHKSLQAQPPSLAQFNCHANPQPARDRPRPCLADPSALRHTVEGHLDSTVLRLRSERRPQSSEPGRANAQRVGSDGRTSAGARAMQM